MTQGLTAKGRERAAAEDVTAWELEREDEADEAAREMVDHILRTMIGFKRRMRAARPQLLRAVNGEESTP